MNDADLTGFARSRTILSEALDASRRRFMTAAGVAAASLIGSRIFPAHAAEATVAMDLSKLSSEADMWRDVQFMNGLGPRYTGTPAHQKFVSFLNDGFASAGLTVERIPHTSLVLWEAGTCGIKTSAGKSIPVAFVPRWSAVTGPNGVTAQVKFCGRAEGASGFSTSTAAAKPSVSIPADIQGKIALVEVTADALPYGSMFGSHVSVLADPTNAGPLPPVMTTAPGWNTNENRLPKNFEADLKKAGAVGLVYSWPESADADASGQYKRTGSDAVPSLWVGGSASKELRALAEQGAPITMTVDAKITNNVSTNTLVATLPGQSAEEIIVLWTHTDGMNALQENGGVAMVHLMKYFASLPKSARKRTIACVLTEGHFAEQYVPSKLWLTERPDLVQKSVSTLAIEHLGCREWVTDPAKNTYSATGKPEFVWAFCQASPGNPNTYAQLMVDAVKGSRQARTVVVNDAPRPIIHSDWMRDPGLAKNPTIGYLSFPPFLLAEGPNGHIDKLSSDQFHDEVQTLARAIHLLDTAPKNV